MLNHKTRFSAPWPAFDHTVHLPEIELNDSRQANHKVNLRLAMSGKKYDTVIAGVGENYVWDFVLTRMKALEFLEFYKEHGSDPWQVTRHNGSVLVGYVLNNPLELEMTARAIVADSVEEVPFRLEFRTKS